MTDPQFSAMVRKAVEDKESLSGMRKSFRTILQRQAENASRIPDLDERKDRLRKTKEDSVGNEQLFLQAVGALRENGARVLMAKDSDSAIRAITGELSGYDLVVKSKSNVTKEIHLSERLEATGVRVVETDLGDRIVQLAGCKAAHPTGPACHLTRQEIAALFTEHFRRRVTDDPMELTRVMREEIASYLDSAKVGITGANAVTAQEGAVVIVHNEGNAAKCAMLPEKHIVVTTPDKVVPSLDDAINVTKLQTFLATGKVVSSYINIVTGTSYTSDIEKKLYRGMHGPKEVVVVFVDDGRLQATDNEAQYCIGCGMCLLHCPVYDVIGPTFGTSGHMGGQGTYLAGSTGHIDESIDAGLYACTSCGACKEVCPSKVDTKSGLIKIRNVANAAGKTAPSEHGEIIASLANYENPWKVPRKSKQKWAKSLRLNGRGEVVYFAGCSTSLLHPGTAGTAIKVLRACGVEPGYLGADEKCCGSTLRKMGFEDLARDRVERCFEDFQKAGAKLVISSCPGCSSSLKHYADIRTRFGIEVQHISEFLDKNLDMSRLRKVETQGTVTYHDPCDLGREQGVFDQPRRLLKGAVEGPFKEMERSRSLSACCGSGSGVKSAFPELANAIALERIGMAEDSRADTMVTSCPWCVQSLRECQGERPKIEVIDLVDLLGRALEGGM